jgi:hypothetical protein
MNFVVNFVLAVIYFGILLVTKPLPQDPKYHKFAGDGPFNCGCNCVLPNLANVISNIPFALVGIFGYFARPTTLAWHGFCWGSILVCFGSGYYHWNPNNTTLVWDRLPMTLVTTSISYILFQKFQIANVSESDLLLWWIIGCLSVMYWKYFDDLRLYAFIQYFPVICLLFWSILWPIPDSPIIALAINMYSAARIFEYFDVWIYQHFWMSGHVVKHVLCAVAMTWCFLLE